MPLLLKHGFALCRIEDEKTGQEAIFYREDYIMKKMILFVMILLFVFSVPAIAEEKGVYSDD